MDFSFKKSSGLSLQKAISLEWLETNGLGGYASSTGINCHTRKYHGLLVSKLDGLPDRYVLLSKLEDVFFCNSDPYYLTAHDYPNFLQDGSFANLEEFSVTSHPCFNYQFEEIEVSKEILMPLNTNTILIKYSIKGAPVACKITIRPLVAARNFHTLCRENNDIQAVTVACTQGISFTPYRGMPTLFFQADTKFNFLPEPLWYRNFIYPKEKERGYEFQEDLFTPGIFTFEISANLPVQEVYFSCSLDENKQELTQIWQQEIARRSKLEATSSGTPLQKELQKTARSFIVTATSAKSEDQAKSQRSSIVAGYHWFLEWGRDAMISLPGLTLYSGEEDLCLEILKEFSKHERQGLLPNTIGSTPEQNSYNTVDTSLWFAWAVQQYYIKTKNVKAIAEYLWPTLKNIYLNYKNGTLHNIKMLSNGLLYAGNKDINITWMDAKVDGVPVTPRYGFQVEVNALWYNMLCFMVYLANNMLDSVKHPLEEEISSLRKAFRETFWNEKLGYLYDYINEEEKNSLLRPNQLFAASLFFSPLTPKMISKVVAVIIEHLYTPYGLRTLAPREPNYNGKYAGNYRERDLAYHNGVIWPWLLGHFGDALVKTTSDKKQLSKILKPIFDTMQSHLYEAGVGTISEIFSEQDFISPDGCISQAWSVAEMLRLTHLLNR